VDSVQIAIVTGLLGLAAIWFIIMAINRGEA
jgi:hypothetical protein